LPTGFVLSADRQFGMELALAPGWRQSARDPEGSISYAGPLGLTMLVHFERAISNRLDITTSTALAELTDAQGLHAATESQTKLAGRPAKRVQGQFEAVGQLETLEACVALEGPRTWVVALIGAPDAVASANATWETMVSTFRLVGARPTPPPRAEVGVPAPSFSLLERVKGPVVINFCATWCVDCRSDMPIIARAVARDRGRFTLIGVDCCGDNQSSVSGFLRELGVQGEFDTVAYDNDGRIAQSYALLGPPTTAFLDKDHVLRNLVIGPVTSVSLAQGLKDIGIT
jgi:cytochrome c biogenesis protein CcmG, thiol:disulfide interchange protein DsbE